MRAVCRARRGGLSARPEGWDGRRKPRRADLERELNWVLRRWTYRGQSVQGDARAELRRRARRPSPERRGQTAGAPSNAVVSAGRTSGPTGAPRALPRDLQSALARLHEGAPETPLPRATRRRPQPRRDGRRRGHPPRDLAGLGLARHVCSGRCRKPQLRPGQEARCADSAHFRDASVTECAQAVRLSELPSPGWGWAALVQAQSSRASQRPGCVPRVDG